MSSIKKRNPAFVIIIGILTGGIYSIYWAVKTKDEIKSLGADIPTGWLLIVPIANFYFWYKYIDGFSEFVKKDNNTLLWFLLYLVVTPVIIIIIQMELNKLAGQNNTVQANEKAINQGELGE